MSTEERLIDSALRSWRSNMDRAGKLFRSLSMDELELEVAPARNRLIYIWGHLTALNDTMFPLFGFGPTRHPHLAEAFIARPDRALGQIPGGPELSQIWSELDVALWTEFQRLSPAEWLQRHEKVSPEDFLREPHRNRYASLLGRTAHLAYHSGQAALAMPRKP